MSLLAFHEVKAGDSARVWSERLLQGLRALHLSAGPEMSGSY